MDSSPIGTDFDDVSKQTAVRGKAYRHLQMLNGRKSITKQKLINHGVGSHNRRHESQMQYKSLCTAEERFNMKSGFFEVALFSSTSISTRSSAPSSFTSTTSFVFRQENMSGEARLTCTYLHSSTRTSRGYRKNNDLTMFLNKTPVR